ncbi:uncharacterized protein RAG0_13657 [Rhynchosporium agropyri]|uniref:Uncharacterized protein n=1 Tax=Rhynchosporium agropyri TaxID=914238 RepID=A0A1E1LE30_9HELO|nr:uncharacterized protein RAG0_13657 [Rhynchosporium agropyri]
MGSASSIEHCVVSELVATKLVELGNLLCTAGDSELGELLKEICDSPLRIFSLRNALLQKLQTIPPPILKEPSESLWLQNYNPPSGISLTDAEQTKLLSLFKEWTLKEADITQLNENALSWYENPSAFCATAPRLDTPSNPEIVGVYFDEYAVVENAQIRNRPRRRVILLETFLAIQREEDSLRRAKRPKQRQADISMRTTAVRSIAGRLWGKGCPPAEVKRREKRLMKMVRYGERWSLINAKGLVLGLPNKSKKFEEQHWSPNEKHAINAFLETHPIYTLREALDNAMEAITREWSRQVQDCRVSTHEKLDLLYQAALLSDQQHVVDSIVDNSRNPQYNSTTSRVVDGQSVPSRAVSITGDLSPRQAHVGAESANRDTYTTIGAATGLAYP